MKRTPEQLKELEEAIAAGRRRIVREFTPEQKEAWLKAAEEEQANKEETIAYFRKILAAEQRPGFLGDLRRAINASGHHYFKLSEETGIDVRRLDGFRADEAELSADEIARLVDALGLRLMQEIPSPSEKTLSKTSA